MTGIENLVADSWLAWVVVWVVAARVRHKKTLKAESLATLLRRTLLPLLGLLAAAFLIRLLWPGLLHEPLAVPRPLWWSVAGLSLLYLGFALTFWARLTLGRNWSGRITLKQDHELIDHGPYRLVRHPIYTGVISSCLGTLVVYRTLFILFILLALVWGFTIKAHIEESYMIENFGPSYENYRMRTGFLIPRLSRKRR